MKIEQLQKKLQKLMEDKYSTKYLHHVVSIDIKASTYNTEVRIFGFSWNRTETEAEKDQVIISVTETQGLQKAVSKFLCELLEIDNKIEVEEVTIPKKYTKKIHQNEKIKNNPELPGNGGRYCQILEQTI